MNRRGSYIAEAAIVLPIIVLATITVVIIILFFYEESVTQSRLHMVLRAEAGAVTERTLCSTANAPGILGTPGIWDISDTLGTPGVSGTSGASGASGVSGAPGVSGVSGVSETLSGRESSATITVSGVFTKKVFGSQYIHMRNTGILNRKDAFRIDGEAYAADGVTFVRWQP